MRIAIGSDHGGIHLKATIAAHLIAQGHDVVDVGTEGDASVDYPDYGHKVAKLVATMEAERGVLVCGTGQGMCMTVNSHGGVRAGVVSDCFSAKMIRAHNDAKVICFGERVVGPSLAIECIDAFLATEFEGGRHERRVGKIDA